METFKNIEKIINEWLEPMLDKVIKENGRWTQAAWRTHDKYNGHHWELSENCHRIPRLVTLEQSDTSFDIHISNTKKFVSPDLRGFNGRDHNVAITITKTDITFNEECNFNHFSREDMYDLYTRIKNLLKPEPQVYHLMKENIVYKTDLIKKIIAAVALCDLCDQIAERAKDKQCLILQTPLAFLDAYHPCSIMITHNWEGINETVVLVCFDEFMLFTPDRIVSHAHPSEIFTKAYYKADTDDAEMIKCDDDEVSEVLYKILSKVYNEPEKVILNKTKEYMRIVYEG